MPRRIYLADDEPGIRRIIQSFLVREGFEAVCFEDGASLLLAFEASPADLLILDIAMPGMDGLSLCALIRSKSTVPIILVSARDSELDRVSGITLGGDDYLVKPFSPLELVARVKAQFRRGEMLSAQLPAPAERDAFADLSLVARRREAQAAGVPLALTPTEFDFMTYLVRHADRAVSKEELLRALWQMDFAADTRVTDDLVKRLRRKLADAGSRARIQTVWGFGYRIAEEGA